MGLMSWLSARFSPRQLIEHVEVVAPPALYNQHIRIGGGLTPEQVTEILRLADTGYMYRLVDLANEARQKDCHLQSILGTSEMVVANLPWQVTAASDSKEDTKAADFTNEFLTNFGMDHDDPTSRDLPHLISHLGGAFYFGYACAETLYERDGGYVVPIGAEPVAPRRFVFDMERGRLRFWDVVGTVPYPGTNLQEEFPGKFILFQPRVNGDVEAREGLMRALVWAALFRSWGLADWMKLAEMAWKPFRIGTYQKEASGLDKAGLRAAIQSLVAGYCVIPNTTEIKIDWPKQRGAPQHAELCAFLAAEMSKAVTGATLTVEQGRVGSNALGNVHNEVRHDIRDARAMAIAAIIRRHLIAPAVRLNFGRSIAVPQFRFLTDEAPDLVAFSQSMVNFKNAGLPIGAKWARGRAGVPDPKHGDELIGGGTYTELPPGPTAEPKRLAA